MRWRNTWHGQFYLGRRAREWFGRLCAAKHKVMKGMDEAVHQMLG
jgi:hypothetical protein